MNELKDTEPWFNIKMSSYQYRKPRCGDKTVVISSYLHNKISYTGRWHRYIEPYWFNSRVIITALSVCYECEIIFWKTLGQEKYQMMLFGNILLASNPEPYNMFITID